MTAADIPRYPPKLVTCPVVDCNWSLDYSLPADISDATLSGIFGWGVFRATHESQARADAERDTRDHLKSHDVVDFVKTIRGLEELVASQVNMILELTGQKPVYSFKGLAVDITLEPK
jgi:hypothetical protein